MMVACRANGLRPIDGPFGDFGDKEGYLSAQDGVLFWATRGNGLFILHK